MSATTRTPTEHAALSAVGAILRHGLERLLQSKRPGANPASVPTTGERDGSITSNHTPGS